MRRGFAVWLLVSVCGCAGPSTEQKKALARSESGGDFAAAVARIQAAKREYGSSNQVLYDLDLAQALADAGRREEADARFAAAQDRMIELWTLSVSKRTGAALANENVDDYRGEDFERALSHVLRSLNLLALDRRRAALIEAQRAEDFLDKLDQEASLSRAYRDDAFARWLAARLYEDLGMGDDARISGEAAQRAYAAYATAYGTNAPGPAQGVGPAEVVVAQIDGVVPRKIRRNDGPLGIVFNASYPDYAPDAAGAARCEVSVGSVTAEARVVEDIEAIARKSLDERLFALKARSALRGAVKLAGTVTGVQSADSEFADVRGWSTLPARVRVTRLRVEAKPGRVRLSCRDSQGRELGVRETPIEPKPGERLWLIERTTL